MLDVVDYAQGGVGLGVVRDDAMCVLNILAAIAIATVLGEKRVNLLTFCSKCTLHATFYYSLTPTRITQKRL